MNETEQHQRIRELETKIESLKKDQADLIKTLGFAIVFLCELPKFKGSSLREIADWLADNAGKTRRTIF